MTIVKVKFAKSSREAIYGISFARKDEGSPLTISQIPEGLCSKTPLRPGLTVLELNGEDARRMNPQEAFGTLVMYDDTELSITAELQSAESEKEKKEENILESGAFFLSKIGKRRNIRILHPMHKQDLICWNSLPEESFTPIKEFPNRQKSHMLSIEKKNPSALPPQDHIRVSRAPMQSNGALFEASKEEIALSSIPANDGESKEVDYESFVKTTTPKKKNRVKEWLRKMISRLRKKVRATKCRKEDKNKTAKINENTRTPKKKWIEKAILRKIKLTSKDNLEKEMTILHNQGSIRKIQRVTQDQNIIGSNSSARVDFAGQILKTESLEKFQSVRSIGENKTDASSVASGNDFLSNKGDNCTINPLGNWCIQIENDMPIFASVYDMAKQESKNSEVCSTLASKFESRPTSSLHNTFNFGDDAGIRCSRQEEKSEYIDFEKIEFEESTEEKKIAASRDNYPSGNRSLDWEAMDFSKTEGEPPVSIIVPYYNGDDDADSEIFGGIYDSYNSYDEEKKASKGGSNTMLPSIENDDYTNEQLQLISEDTWSSISTEGAKFTSQEKKIVQIIDVYSYYLTQFNGM